MFLPSQPLAGGECRQKGGGGEPASHGGKNWTVDISTLTLSPLTPTWHNGMVGLVGSLRSSTDRRDFLKVPSDRCGFAPNVDNWVGSEITKREKLNYCQVNKLDSLPGATE